MGSISPALVALMAVLGSKKPGRAPRLYREACWCFKRIYGLLLFAARDSNKVNTWASSGSPGSVGDVHVWKHSAYKSMLMSGMFHARLGYACWGAHTSSHMWWLIQHLRLMHA